MARKKTAKNVPPKKSNTKAKIQQESKRSWSKEINDRLPVIKFIGGFIIFTIVFYLATNADWFQMIRIPLVTVYTKLSSMILNIFGMNTTANGSYMSSPQFSVNVEEGCDAVIPIILFITAILVFPTKMKHKLKGLSYGVPILFFINLFRIITLFLTGIYAPKLFEFMHVEFWQTLFIICTVFLFIYWLRQAQPVAKAQPAPASSST